MEKGIIVDKVIEMYSLYDCDAWRSPSSMSVEYETLERSAMNEKIKEILLGDPKSFELTNYLDSDEQDELNDELTNYLDSDEQDELNELEETDNNFSKKDFWEKKLEQLVEKNGAWDLVDMIEQQQINYLDLEIRELDLEKLTVNGGDY